MAISCSLWLLQLFFRPLRLFCGISLVFYMYDIYLQFIYSGFAFASFRLSRSSFSRSSRFLTCPGCPCAPLCRFNLTFTLFFSLCYLLGVLFFSVILILEFCRWGTSATRRPFRLSHFVCKYK